MRSLIKVSALLSLAGLAACATGMPAPVAIPDAIKGAPNEKVAMMVPAKGVQVYECRAKAGQPASYEWAFIAPDAELFDANGTKIGKHYAGPVWESNDGSKVAGAVKGRADAPQTGAIPWLLLTTTASGPKGSFSATTAIQRVNTTGGVAPVTPCGQANAGTSARVPYTADYYFLAAQ